jgi:hypothetical protein
MGLENYLWEFVKEIAASGLSAARQAVSGSSGWSTASAFCQVTSIFEFDGRWILQHEVC